MTTRLLDQCELCGNPDLQPVLSLGTSPPTCAMIPIGERRATEPHHPLELLYCDQCTLTQLSVIVDPGVVFPPDYPYSSGNSRALHDNFEDLAREAAVVAELAPADLVVDIGANDGTLLSKFPGWCRTVGVEPTGQARRIAGPFYEAFFDERIAMCIRAQFGPAKVITACNTLAHIDHMAAVMRGIDALLADDGVLIAENHDIASVVDDRQWDVVYHEHLRFYSPYSFAALLNVYGFRATDWHPIPTHGGSFRMFASRGTQVPDEMPERVTYDFDGLARDAAEARRAIRGATADGAWGIGATARATTVINYAGLDAGDVPYVCEVAGSDKIGHYVPGTSIEVVDEARLFEEQPERAVLFSWHLSDVIVPKLRERGYCGEIILPLPELQRV